MERELSNSINMIRSTQTYLTNNTTATAGIAAFAPAKLAVDNKLVLLDGLNQIAGVTSKGVTTDTNVIRQAMTNIAFKVGSAVSAFAASINNNTLRTKVTYSLTAFGRFKKEEVDDICQTIHDEADTNIAAAGAFGYVAADVTDLQTAIDLYRISAQNPRQAIISKTQAITQMKSIVRDIIDNYYEKLMDKMVDTLLLTNENFHKGYRLSRETINIGVTHAKVRGTVRDSNTVPLVGVSFTIFNTGTTQQIGQTLTTVNGSFGISPIPAGDYDFVWSFAGYQTVNETNVHISAGKELQRKITMQPFSGITIIREGDISSPGQVAIDLTGVNGTPASMVTIEVSGPAGVRFGAVANQLDPPGPVHYDKETGIITMSLDQFKTLIGFGGLSMYLVAQNIGMVLTHFKLTFTNLEP